MSSILTSSTSSAVRHRGIVRAASSGRHRRGGAGTNGRAPLPKIPLEIPENEADPAPSPPSPLDERRRREAARLRDNLRRRKQQSRERDRPAAPPAREPDPS